VNRRMRVLFLAENLPGPFDRRVWPEARAQRGAGYIVSIICSSGRRAAAMSPAEPDVET
jgi:hypothetical protein